MLIGLHAEHDRKPRGGEAGEHVFGGVGARQGADHHEGEQREQHQAQDDSEFLRRHREHEIGVAVRQAALGDALAGPEPEPAAVPKSLHRGIDLKGVAGSGIDEALDAAGDVRHQQIGAEQPGARGAGKPDHPDHPHAGDEEQGAPHHQDQHGLAEVGLHHEQRDQHHQKDQRHRGRGHFRPPRRFRKQPGGQHHESRLGGFGGLDIDADQRDPAPRALDLGPEQQRRHDQRHADKEHDQRGAPDLPRRQERHPDQHGEGRQQKQHVAVEEMKRVESDPGRYRRARRQRQDDAAQDQRKDRRKLQAVDRPPPVAKRISLFAGEHGHSPGAKGSAHWSPMMVAKGLMGWECFEMMRQSRAPDAAQRDSDAQLIRGPKPSNVRCGSRLCVAAFHAATRPGHECGD